jgi:SH3 domain-containing protein
VDPLRRFGWLLIPALLGVGIGLAVFRPWQASTSLSLSSTSPASSASASVASSPAASHKNSPAPSCPIAAVHLAVQPAVIPRGAWVHASDGLNVRATPSTSAHILTMLAVGTHVVVQGEQKNPDGITWYKIGLANGQFGWVNAMYTTNYPINQAVADFVTLWLPEGYSLRALDTRSALSQWASASLVFMFVGRADAFGNDAISGLPGGMPARSTWQPQETDQLMVGDQPAADQVFSVNLGSCEELIHEIELGNGANQYGFVFITDRATAGVVAEVLDSATLK